MPSWKKIITSGSDAVLNNVTASFFTGSFVGDGSQLTGITATIPNSVITTGSITSTQSITGSLIISGSTLTVTGSVRATSFTGSLQGTGSWAVSASQDITASYAVTESYVSNIHRDIRTFYNLPMMLNMLVMVDDFTIDNGATYLLSNSHLNDIKPDEKYFYNNAVRAEGCSGSILLFDSLLWHAAGINKTSFVRRALTLAFTRPFQKQQMDYPRLLGYQNGELFPEVLKQIIGYNSRVPCNLDEWYQPDHKRFYK
jgi:hypothetical protein